jgi:hypothetical protein
MSFIQAAQNVDLSNATINYVLGNQYNVTQVRHVHNQSWSR